MIHIKAVLIPLEPLVGSSLIGGGEGIYLVLYYVTVVFLRNQRRDASLALYARR